MSKIGLKVTMISAGVQEILTLNGGEWTRKVVDIRSDIKALSGKAFEDGADVLMLSFVPNGSLLTLFHTLKGRSGDLLSAWMFIPNNCAVSADEEMMLLQQVKAELAKSQVQDWSALEGLFAKEYPAKEPFNYFESQQGKPCAVRYFGTGTDYGLKEMLGERIFQREYMEHKYIFLLDKSYNVVADDKLVNYTDEPLREWIYVKPPQLPAGITAKLDGRAFTTPQIACVGQKMQLSLERVGFAPLSSEITASRMPIVIDMARLTWRFAIAPNSFRVTNDEGQDITSSCQFQIDGQRLYTPMTMSEADAARPHRIVVSCHGHSDFSTAMPLAGRRFPIPITLKRRRDEEVYCINGVECPNLRACPEGYEEVNRRRANQKVLIYCEPSRKAAGGRWKMIAIIGIVAALLLGVAAGGLGYYLLFGKKIETDDGLQIQYDCLNKNEWVKAELDTAGLNGLFEDLQNVDLTELKGHWQTDINASTNPNWKEFSERLSKIQPTDKIKQDVQKAYKNKISIDWKNYLKMLEGKNPPSTSTGTPPPPKRYASLNERNQHWNKSALENDSLIGLFEDLKKVNLTSIENKWDRIIDREKNPQWKNFMEGLADLKRLYPNKYGKLKEYPQLKGTYGNAETGIKYTWYLTLLGKDLSGEGAPRAEPNDNNFSRDTNKSRYGQLK